MLKIPRTLIAGLSTDWESSLANYPSSEWNLLITIAGNIAIPTTSTPQDNGGWLTEIDGADFTDAEPGDYYWSARVINAESGVARSVGAGNLTVTADLATVDEPYDGRSKAKKIHDGILQAIADLSSGKIASYQIEGRGATYRSYEELNKAESYWRQRVLAEQAKIDAANGLPNPRTIRAKFIG